MKYYVAYGSNLNKWQMAYRCPDAIAIGKTEMKGWRLKFNGVATIVRNERYSVPVGIWLISDRDEKELDRYEGYPRLYRKESVLLKIRKGDGFEYEDAIVYVMNEGRRKESPPSDSYYETILHGYEDFGMDCSVLNKAVEESYEKSQS